MKNLFETTKFRIANRISHIAEPKVVILDSMDLSLAPAEAYHVAVPFVLPPLISSNQALVLGGSFAADITLENPQTELLTDWLNSQLDVPATNIVVLSLLPTRLEIEDQTLWFGPSLSPPIIEQIELLGSKTNSDGKKYQKESEGDTQLSFFDKTEICQHGMRKSWCAECLKSERKERDKAKVQLDPFDLILPTLHPPLGINFDNPVAFTGGKTLYPFQCDGIKFLAEHQHALLGDEMGLGKSIQTIVALRLLLRTGKIKNGLLLCPKAVVTDWEAKLSDWAPELRVQKIRGTQSERGIQWNTPSHIYLTTYESFREDLTADQARTIFDICILDEIQKIKNPNAKLSQAIRHIQTNWRWGLSGTPLENKIDDVVAIFDFLVPHLFKGEQNLNARTVREKIKPYFLRRRKNEALKDLKPKEYEKIYLDLLPSQRKAYDFAEKEGIDQLNAIGETKTIQHVFALIVKLKQICNLDPATQQSCKLEYLVDRLEELSEQGDKALVFSQFPEKTLKAISPRLEAFSPLIYDGSLSDRQRENIVESFQKNDENKILLMSVKAGGVGITLTRASYVFHYDLWWNPSIAAQAEDRAHRIGQEKTVFVYLLYTRDTIEMRIKNLLDQKRALFNLVIDELTDTDFTKMLTEEEIFGLFNLEKPKRREDPRTLHSTSPVVLDLRTVTPQDFERLIGRLYETMGYAVRMTPISRDGGIDVYATRFSDSGTEQIAIQCKHYPERKVSVEVVRSLYGVMQANPNTARGILVTSGEFTPDCVAFAAGKRIELINGSKLIGLLEKYGVSV